MVAHPGIFCFNLPSHVHEISLVISKKNLMLFFLYICNRHRTSTPIDLYEIPYIYILYTNNPHPLSLDADWMNIYIYIHVCVCVFVYIYIYIRKKPKTLENLIRI